VVTPASTRTPGPTGSTASSTLPIAGQEVVGRVLGVDAAFDGVAALAEIRLGEGQRLPRGDPDLQLDQIDAGHQLGDGVLHLERVFISRK
jgi:hypothetical protein